MADVMAVVSKAIFEKQARGLSPGQTWPTASYVSQNKGLAPLADGGRLFLVTVRPPDESLWLVGVLERPAFDGTQWSASPNAVAIRDISALRSAIKFANGAGLPAKAGVLGMSLQTPRVLADSDVALLLGAAARGASSSATASAVNAAAAPKPVASASATEPTAKVAKSAGSPPAKVAAKPGTAKAKPAASGSAAAKASASSTTAGNASAGLSGIVAFAEQAKWPEVLAGLLAIWRDAPHTAIAEQIARIGALAAPPADQVAKKWEAIAAKPDPAVLDALLATVRDKGSVKARPRLEQLAKWPADPRFDRWVVQHYAEPPLTSTGARPYWTRLQPLLHRVSDSTAIAELRRARGKLTKYDHDEFMAGHIDRALPKLPAVAEVAPPAADLAALAKLAALGVARPAPDAKRADELLAAVLDKPGDDTLRVVLADALSEIEDPRGELIALQLDPATSPDKDRRIRQIIKQSRAHLLGPLDAVLKDEVTFTNGFLSRCALKRASSNELELAIKKVAGHPLWATVEHLEGPKDWDITRHRVMRSLRSLANTDVGIEELAQRPNLEALRDGLHKVADVAIVLAPTAFPALRRLDLTCVPAWATEIVHSPLARRLDDLQIRFRWSTATPIQQAVGLLTEVPPALASFTLHIVRNDGEDWRSFCQLTRSPAGFAVRVGISKMASKYGEREQVRVMAADVLATLEVIAPLSPASLVLAPGFTAAEARTTVERAVRDLGGTVES